MDFDDVPAGFAMALARSEEAVNAYAMMTKEEMRQIVAHIAQENKM